MGFFHVKKFRGKFQIVRDEDNVVVGTSRFKARALRSIGYREAAVLKSIRKNKKK